MPSRDAARRRTRLRVAITPTFCRQLVMPKLELFRNAYPDVELILQVSIPLLNVTAEKADLEVRFGTGGYTDLEHRLLMTEEVTPACSPSYLNEFGPYAGFASEAEVAEARLIRSPLEPWGTWFSHCGLARSEPQVGSQFNDLGLAYDAAASGFGVALVRLQLGAAWFEHGRLVRLSNQSVPSPLRHDICWQPGTLERWECAAFVDWLTQALAPA
jgi:DNA-binding transcriptional LysR family regulator